MIIEIKEITKEYGGKKVVDIPFLEIHQGEITGVVGNNGAGKTTLFRMILDLVRPTTGRILSKGDDVSKNESWKTYTGSYLDEGFLIDYLAPEEYFQFIGGLNNLNKEDVYLRLKSFDEMFAGEVLGKRKYIRNLSKGNKNKVGIAGAMISKPQVLVLDEPFANLDPTTQFRLKKIIKDYRTSEGMVLISSHDLNHAAEVCERIIVLEKGKIVKDLKTTDDTLTELQHYFS